MPDLLRAVRVDGDDDPFLCHERGVVGDRVVGFDFVGPPVREGGGARAVRGDLLRDLVALQHVLEGGDPEAELLREPDELEDLVGPIRVGVDEALPLQDLDERLELQVAPRRDQILLAGLPPSPVLLPLLPVLARLDERLADHVHDAHPRCGITLGRPRRWREIRALRVLAQREFDPGRRPSEEEAAGVLPPAELDHHGPPTDRVRTAVEDARRRHAAPERSVDVDVVGVEDIGDVDHRRDGDTPLVHAPVHGDVRVGVDDPRHDVQAGAVDDAGVSRRANLLADRGDFPIPDQDRPVLDRPLRDRQDRRVLDQRRGRALLRCRRGRDRQPTDDTQNETGEGSHRRPPSGAAARSVPERRRLSGR